MPRVHQNFVDRTKTARRYLSEARENLMPAKMRTVAIFSFVISEDTLPKEPSLSDCCVHQMITNRTRLLDEKVADVLNGSEMVRRVRTNIAPLPDIFLLQSYKANE